MLEYLLQHWILISVIILTLVILWAFAVLSKYVRLLLNIFRDTPPPLMRRHFDYEHLEGHHVNFRAFDGTSLRGMFLSRNLLNLSLPDGSLAENGSPKNGDNGHFLNSDTRGVIIFCHEFGADMYSCSRYCLPLLQAGFDIFTFDFRSHGQSSLLPGYNPWHWCTDKEVSDCLGALAYVRAELEDRELPVKIGLFGISRGAGAAIMTASHHHSASLIHAVLADSAFSTDTTIEWLMKKWVHIFAKVRFVYENHQPFFWHFLRWLVLIFAGVRFHCKFPSARKALKRFKNTPIFFIHGLKDSYIRPEQAQSLYNTASDPRQLWLVPHAKHNHAVATDPRQYAQRTVTFFETYLSPDKKSIHVDKEQKVSTIISSDRSLCRSHYQATPPTVPEKSAPVSSNSG